MKYCIQFKKYLLPAIVMLALFSFPLVREDRFSNISCCSGSGRCRKSEKDNNNNYTIQVDLSNLSEPERLQPPKNLCGLDGIKRCKGQEYWSDK